MKDQVKSSADPMEALREEHQVILRVLKVLDALLHRRECEGAWDTQAMAECVTFFRLYADACHHGKEEDILFPELQAAGMLNDCGPVGILMSEHVQGRALVSQMARALDGLRAGDISADASLRQGARAYLALLSDHIHKEDHCFFHMAGRSLSREGGGRVCAAYGGECNRKFEGYTREQLEELAQQLESHFDSESRTVLTSSGNGYGTPQVESRKGANGRSTKQECDVIIAGNGVLACSLAFALVRESPDLRVTLIGPRPRPGCASLAAGAMLASFAEVDADTLNHPVTRYKFELSRQAAQMWPEWVDRVNADAGMNHLAINFGTYVIHNTRADGLDDESYEAIKSVLGTYDEQFEEVAPQSIPGFSPSTEGRALHALYIPGEGAVNPEVLFAQLERALARAAHVVVVDESVSQVRRVESRIKEVVTQSGTVLSAPQVVIAAGAQSQPLIDQIPSIRNRIPRIFYGVGVGIIVKTDGFRVEKVIRTANRGLACGVHLVPRAPDCCYLGASNFITHQPEFCPRMASLYTLLQGAMEQVHTRFYKCQVVRQVVGHRPTTADTFPVVGETSHQGLWILSGTKRDGIHMSPLYSQSFAREILGNKPMIENRFVPERRLIHTMTRQEGIDKAVRHLRSAGYQHEFRLPKSNWDDMVTDMLRRKVESVYDSCGILDFGIPPEMLDMYRYGHVRPTSFEESVRAGAREHAYSI